MSTNVIETPRQWCARTLNHIDSEHGPVQRWVIKGQDTKYDSFKVIATIPRPESARSADDAVDLLHAAIEREATGAEKRRVRVFAFFRGVKNQYTTKTWQFAPDFEDDEDDDASVGAPGHHAIVAQALRHNRAMFRHSMCVQTSTVQVLAEQVQRTNNENIELRARDLENFKARQQMLNGQLERETKAQQSKSLTKALDAAVGVAQWKLMGSAAPQSETETSIVDSIRAFGESLTDQQRQVIAGALRPEQQYSFAQLAQLAQATDGDDTPPASDTPRRGDAPPLLPPVELAVVNPEGLAELRRRLPPKEYEDAVALLCESQALLRDPVGTLLSPDADAGPKPDSEHDNNDTDLADADDGDDATINNNPDDNDVGGTLNNDEDTTP